ncbi:DUF4345 domain-containing protein [Pseudophaeobacter sp.]|uniref:DUF4345 domain-containing protein n=1 Tax=Pseudophaeobacter sp. TaxID=1971739 RepID=UPI003297AE6D
MINDRYLLAFAATGLIPIALGYGLNPPAILTYLYGFEVSGINQPHIFRAVMGLYLGQIIFWYLGFAKKEFRRPALYMMATFMLGLASGRLLSLVLDGLPNGLLLLYFCLETLLGTFALVSLRQSTRV